jgi:hypothetical protein
MVALSNGLLWETLYPELRPGTCFAFAEGEENFDDFDDDDFDDDFDEDFEDDFDDDFEDDFEDEEEDDEDPDAPAFDDEEVEDDE